MTLFKQADLGRRYYPDPSAVSGVARTGARLSVGAAPFREGHAMPQMFDWIFFAIMIPFPAFLVWDFYRNRDLSKSAQL